MEKEILFSSEVIRKRVKELAARITADYQDKEPLLIGVLNGAVIFVSDLVREIRIPTKLDFIRAASYGSGMSSSGTVRVTKDVEKTIENRAVLLVEDIVDSGLTLDWIIRHLEKKGPESLRVCALIDKLERRERTTHIDYCGFRVEEGFLVGYGLDFDEKYRYLPDICRLKALEE